MRCGWSNSPDLFLIFEMVDKNKAVHLGAVLAVRTVPQLLFGVWAGVLTDRLDRRRILLFDKIGVLTINIAFAVLLLGGWLELWHIYAYAFVRGSMMAFDQPARVSMIPSIVPANRVTNAVALMSVTQNSMRIFGAALGGISYAVFGAEGTFVAISVIYTGAVYFTIGCECPRARATRASSSSRSSRASRKAPGSPSGIPRSAASSSSR